ncbi:glycerophosphodiester phosphodiesterase family protein [Flavitalea sp. BT771]|uniref:glycerophosphodiester phosphodiesterase family protein n=1 Tax=Flavitalea sp. BT771 TaxID=3063329 RepID=UPI0026E36BCD|nr:glycerophosphodiester phosphodiesterase family protein [Flavitalea sp. BT771]MDO6432289.1 glycerophosphodiester phosphodiesterase family protein [Flavitalea sp. BT771]MDV6221199.1 glycerophosphodiester phosphodiesterase family protein [Flavitalea sp. BT771]
MRKFVIFIIAHLLIEAGDVPAQSTRPPLPAVRNDFVVIAHRGNHVKVPENTVASVNEAILCGADYVEMDLRTTKDGRLVLSHDASVDRMTNGKGNVRDLAFEEIEKLKVGADGGEAYRVPTFEDVLNACKGRINIYLDFKDADPATAYRQIKAAGMEKQVVVYINKAEQYGQWKKAAPSMPLMGSLPKEIKTPEQFLRFLDQTPLEVLDNVYDTALQAVARKMGIALWPDVQSDEEGPAVWDQALAWQIQGMQTDHPEALVNYLKQRKRRSEPAVKPGQK